MKDSKCVYAGKFDYTYVVLYNSIESVISTIKLIDDGFSKREHYTFVFITPDVVSQRIDHEKNLYTIADVLKRYAESRLHSVDEMGYMDYGDKWFDMIHTDYLSDIVRKSKPLSPCHGCIMYSYMCATEMALEYENTKLVLGESSDPISCFYMNSQQALERMHEFIKLNKIEIVRPLEDLSKDEMMKIYKEFMLRYGLEDDDFQYPLCMICEPNPNTVLDKQEAQVYINEVLYPRLGKVIEEIKSYQKSQQFVYSDRKEK